MTPPRKGFDCARCHHRGEEKGSCDLLSVIPMFNTCAGYLPEDQDEETSIDDLPIIRRGSDLFMDNEDVIPDVTPQDWISLLRLAAKTEMERLIRGGVPQREIPVRIRHFINDWSPIIEE